jgi:hypothetical protein
MDPPSIADRLDALIRDREDRSLSRDETAEALRLRGIDFAMWLLDMDHLDPDEYAADREAEITEELEALKARGLDLTPSRQDGSRAAKYEADR